MITFGNLGQMGRLGNQLFQYAILLAVGAKNNYEVRIPKIKNRVWHGQKCLLDNFNITAKEFEGVLPTYSEKKEDWFKYNPDVFNIPDNTNISGFFQNYQYYKDFENIIKRELTPKKNIIERNQKILSGIKGKHPGYMIVSLHLRRGDTDLGMYGGDKLDMKSRWGVFWGDAQKLFSKCKFLVFTGGNRSNSTVSDYEWCKKNLNSEEYIYAGSNSTIDDFTLMTLCDAHVLSPVSSLSWWVGFLSDSKVVAPKKYLFLDKEVEEGFYPPDFILL